MSKVSEAIHNVQKELCLAGMPKERRNQQQGFNYRGIDDVMIALSPLLVRYNLQILPRCVKRETTEQVSKSGGKLFYTVVDMEFDFVSVEDDSRVLVRMSGEAMDSGDKSTSKAQSVAYREAAIKTFCIPIQGQPEADAETYEVSTEQPGAKQETQTATAQANGKPKLGKETALNIQQNILGSMAQKSDAWTTPEHIADAVKIALEKLDYTADQFTRLMQPLRYEWYRLACVNSDSKERDEEIVAWLNDDLIRNQIGEKAADSLLKCMDMNQEESRRELGKLSPSYR